MSSLLPTNSTALERALEQAGADALAMPVPTRSIINPDTCPSAWLPWLAWARRVERWDDNWTDADKRQAIKNSYAIHRKKGTLWAIQQTILDHGYSLRDIVIWQDCLPLDGSHQYNGLHMYGSPSGRYMYYIVIADKGLTGVNLERLYQDIISVAPARMLLTAIYSAANNLILDGSCQYNGESNYGEAYVV